MTEFLNKRMRLGGRPASRVREERREEKVARRRIRRFF
jgi:hypothetical protein